MDSKEDEQVTDKIEKLFDRHETRFEKILSLKLDPVIEDVKNHATVLFGQTGVNGLNGRLTKLQAAVSVMNGRLIIGGTLVTAALTKVFFF